MRPVRVQHERAGLFQVQLAALQQLLALGSRPQAQTEQLLHLRRRRGGGSAFVCQRELDCCISFFIVPSVFEVRLGSGTLRVESLHPLFCS